MLKLKRTVPIMCLIAASVVGAGIYLAPNHRELALMQMDDFNFKHAFADYSRLQKEGDKSINVLAPLVNLNVYYGDLDKAIALLEIYVNDHPHAIEARKKLAELYKSTERFNKYCAILEELEVLAPSAQTLRQLADTYSFLGRNRDEMKALSRLVESKDYEELESDYYKLASFLRVDNQPDEAIQVLRGYIEAKRYQVSVDLMYLMLQLLQDEDHGSKALSMANAYLRKHVKEDDAIAMSSIFEMHKQFDSAFEVLEPFIDKAGHSTNLEQQAVDIMIEQQKDEAVFAMLKAQQIKDGTLPPSLAVTLTDLAVARADFAEVELLVRSQDLNQLPEDVLLRYADIAYRQKRIDLADLMVSRISPDVFSQMPMLKAVLDIAHEDNAKTFAELSSMSKGLFLPPETKIIVAGIFIDHDQSQAAFDMLANISLDEMLSSFDPLQYAELYLSVNGVAKAEPLLAAARPKSSPEVKKAIDEIELLFAAAAGKQDIVKQHLQGFTDGKEAQFWSDVFDLALKYHHDDVSLLVAQQIYKLVPTDDNRVQLGEALTANSRFSEAVSLLQPLIDKNADARSLFLDAIATWGINAGGADHLRSAELAQMTSAIAAALKSPKLSQDDRRELAYVLEDIGFLGQAERLLVQIAADQPYGSSDVDELVGFWEDHPSGEMSAWIDARVKQASVEEEAKWLTYLNDNDKPQDVVTILRDQGEIPPSLMEQYVEALVALNDKSKLEAGLGEALSDEKNPELLKKLALLADQEDVEGLTEKAWRKVLAVTPDDPDAAKAIGLLDYDAGKFEEAEPLLKAALAAKDDDYQVNMIYGEILQQDDRKSDARPYLNRALQQISDIPEKDVTTREDEAYLLYLTDHLSESLSMFRKMLAQDPHNADLRATIAEILTETGHFDEASGLLAQP